MRAEDPLLHRLLKVCHWKGLGGLGGRGRLLPWPEVEHTEKMGSVWFVAGKAVVQITFPKVSMQDQIGCVRLWHQRAAVVDGTAALVISGLQCVVPPDLTAGHV